MISSNSSIIAGGPAAPGRRGCFLQGFHPCTPFLPLKNELLQKKGNRSTTQWFFNIAMTLVSLSGLSGIPLLQRNKKDSGQARKTGWD